MLTPKLLDEACHPSCSTHVRIHVEDVCREKHLGEPFAHNQHRERRSSIRAPLKAILKGEIVQLKGLVGCTFCMQHLLPPAPHAVAAPIAEWQVGELVCVHLLLRRSQRVHRFPRLPRAPAIRLILHAAHCVRLLPSYGMNWPLSLAVHACVLKPRGRKLIIFLP